MSSKLAINSYSDNKICHSDMNVLASKERDRGMHNYKEVEKYAKYDS